MAFWKLNYIERQTRYFGGPKKGGSAPRATGFMIAPSSSQAFQAGASAQRPNYLFKFRQIILLVILGDQEGLHYKIII